MLEYSEYKDEDITSPHIFFFVSRIEDAKRRVALLDWFTARQRPTIYSIPQDLVGKDIIMLSGKVQELAHLQDKIAVHVPKVTIQEQELHKTDPTDQCFVYGILAPEGVADKLMFIKLADNASLPPFSMGDRFELQKGMIANYQGDPCVTDVGKFLANQLLLVFPFGDLIPYINERFNTGSLDDKVAKLILAGKINRSMFNAYMNYGYWYGEDGSLATPTWSEKSLTTDPAIAIRKKELLEEFKDQLHDPIVLAKIEQELVQMDKDYLKGDSSAPFYAVGGGKTFDEQRKKMFITFGLSVAFDKNTGNYEFVEESLTDGWNANTLPVAANDIRRGSYGRGVGTAKGGEQTKFILRLLQDVEISENDCGSTRGLPVGITASNKKDYLGRWTVDGKLLDEQNIDSFVGKTVELRSAMYCKTNPGYCNKCLGELFRNLDMKSVGMNAVAITSTMTTIAMKAMHVSGIKTTKITDFHKFVR